jgi:hypothetical protein
VRLRVRVVQLADVQAATLQRAHVARQALRRDARRQQALGGAAAVAAARRAAHGRQALAERGRNAGLQLQQLHAAAQPVLELLVAQDARLRARRQQRRARRGARARKVTGRKGAARARHACPPATLTLIKPHAPA